MFVRVSTLVLAIAASAIAAPGGGTTSSQCDTGNIQCCNGPAVPANLLPTTITQGLGLSSITAPIGTLVALGCSPIGLISSTQCSQQAVCCSNNNANGLVNVVCSPLDFNL